MKKSILFTLLIAGLLASCGETECNHIDEDKNHLCDLCGTPLSEHKDNDNNHYCDYCGDQLNGCIDEDLDGKCDICGEDMVLPYEYAEWPTKAIQDEVIVVSGSSVIIPAYEKADDIEINTDDEVDDGYFSIYCYTENKKSEDEYKQILLDAGWEVENEKDEQGYISAYDPNYEVWINFGYFEDYSDLEICVTYCYKTKWPGDYIAESLQDIVPGTETVIPEFEAYTIVATYYPLYGAIAINGYGFKSTIIEDYTEILKGFSWEISFNKNSDEWNAISPNKDVEIHFYIDESRAEFNVDVMKHAIVVEGWPESQINQAIAELEATGTVPTYIGGNQTSFAYSSDVFGYIVVVYLKSGVDETTEAENYINYIKSLGYEYVGNDYVDDYYALPGTTLGITAYYASAGCFTISFTHINELRP